MDGNAAAPAINILSTPVIAQSTNNAPTGDAACREAAERHAEATSDATAMASSASTSDIAFSGTAATTLALESARCDRVRPDSPRSGHPRYDMVSSARKAFRDRYRKTRFSGRLGKGSNSMSSGRRRSMDLDANDDACDNTGGGACDNTDAGTESSTMRFFDSKRLTKSLTELRQSMAQKMRRTRTIPVSQLSEYIEWGDLVLFTGRGHAAKCARCCMRTDVDHIAIVVPYDPDPDCHDVRILEATLPTGVWLCEPGFLIKMRNPSSWYSDKFEKVRIQKMRFDRSAAAKQTLYEFSKTMEHTRYEQNYAEIMRAFFNVDQPVELSSVFCSELVAEALQRIAVLPRDKSSNSFLPSHFSGRSKAVLEEGCKYGSLLTIDFLDHELEYSTRALERVLQKTLEEEDVRMTALRKRRRGLVKLQSALRLQRSVRSLRTLMSDSASQLPSAGSSKPIQISAIDAALSRAPRGPSSRTREDDDSASDVVSPPRSRPQSPPQSPEFVETESYHDCEDRERIRTLSRDKRGSNPFELRKALDAWKCSLCGQTNPFTAPLCRKWVIDGGSEDEEEKCEEEEEEEEEAQASTNEEGNNKKTERRTHRCGGTRPIQQFIHAIVRKELFYIGRARNHVDTQHALKRISTALAVTAKISHDTMDELKERVADMRTDAKLWDAQAERVYNDIEEHTQTL